ncbi:MAG: DinB family protein [Anaerolineae bacterium]
MYTKQNVLAMFQENLKAVKAQTAGLTDEQCLLQPPFRGNCMHWVVGHILSNRSEILETLGAEPILTPAQHKRYGYGSEPICGPEEGLFTISQMLSMLEDSQVRLETALNNASETLLAEPRTLGPFKMTCAELVLFLFRHDCYHTGQTEILRQLAGTNDKV